MIVVGIDPGLTGAVAVLDQNGSFRTVFDIPTMQRAGKASTVKNQVNGTALNLLLLEHLTGTDRNEVLIIIELVGSMPKQGVATMLSLGHTCGMIEGIVAARGYPHRLVRPQDWKKAMKLTATKEQCRAYAQRLFPDAELKLMKHHNRAEALLIAEYGRREYA